LGCYELALREALRTATGCLSKTPRWLIVLTLSFASFLIARVAVLEQWIFQHLPSFAGAWWRFGEAIHIPDLKPAGMAGAIPLALAALLGGVLSGFRERYVPPSVPAAPDRTFPRHFVFVVASLAGASVLLWGLFEKWKLLPSSAATTIFLGVAIAAGIWTWRHAAKPIAALGRSERWLLGAGLLLLAAYFSTTIEHWNVAFIGDDWGAAEFAELILNGGAQAAYRVALEASGAGEFQTVTLSLWQVLFIALFGPTNLAWRGSMAALVLLCVWRFYRFLRDVTADAPRSRSILLASAGAVFFATAELVVVWASTGKMCAQFLVPWVFALGAYARCRKGRAKSGAFVPGLALGAGAFISLLGTLIAAVTLVLWIALDAVQSRKTTRWRSALYDYVTLASGTLLLGAPVLVQTDYLGHVFLKSSFLNRHEPMRIEGAFGIYVKTVRGLLTPWRFYKTDHFLGGNCIELVFASAFWTGLAGILAMRRARGFLVLAAYGVTVVSVAGIAQYSAPPVTRSLLLIPPMGWIVVEGWSYWLSQSKKASTALLVLTVVSAMHSLFRFSIANPSNRSHNAFELELRDHVLGMRYEGRRCTIRLAKVSEDWGAMEIIRRYYGHSATYRVVRDDVHVEHEMQRAKREGFQNCIVRSAAVALSDDEQRHLAIARRHGHDIRFVHLVPLLSEAELQREYGRAGKYVRRYATWIQ
jgi:hypothetical protein